MKIHLYRNVSKPGDSSLADSIKNVSHMALSGREKLIDGKLIFLERCSTGDKRLFSMDFTYRRTTSGPGHSVVGKETTDFELENEVGFGEQTAIVYDPKHEYIAVQYNHHGPRAATIVRYLESFNKKPLKWNPVLRNDVYTELAKSGLQTKLRLKVDANQITEKMYRENVPLAAAHDIRKQTNAGMIDMIISLGQG